jgi:hypothetical protein
VGDFRFSQRWLWSVISSGIFRWKSTDVSEERIASISRVEELAEQETGRLCLPPDFTLVSCLAYSSALKMEATCSSEAPVDFQWTTRRCIPEDRILQSEFCFENKDLGNNETSVLCLILLFRKSCRLRDNSTKVAHFYACISEYACSTINNEIRNTIEKTKISFNQIMLFTIAIRLRRRYVGLCTFLVSVIRVNWSINIDFLFIRYKPIVFLQSEWLSANTKFDACLLRIRGKLT